MKFEMSGVGAIPDRPTIWVPRQALDTVRLDMARKVSQEVEETLKGVENTHRNSLLPRPEISILPAPPAHLLSTRAALRPRRRPPSMTRPLSPQA